MEHMQAQLGALMAVGREDQAAALPWAVRPRARAGLPDRAMPITIRQATLADVAFIDGLQKQHSRELGFLPTMAIVGKIKLRQVLIAEVPVASSQWPVVAQATDGPAGEVRSPTTTGNGQLATGVPAGYLIAADRYFKRDEVGYITQINVVADYRRTLVAAQLLAAQFDKSAYGCKLYSCWCAQDLKANAFWEAMGFVPIAFRTGSRKGRRSDGATKRRSDEGEIVPSSSSPSVASSFSRSAPSPRMHIFWQKRIRENDTTTPYWYPSETGGGQMREDRLVFPIPPGVSWRDVLPVVLPGGSDEATQRRGDERKVVPPSSSPCVAPSLRRSVAKPQKHTMPPGANPNALWFSVETLALMQAQREAAEAIARGEAPPANAPVMQEQMVGWGKKPKWMTESKPKSQAMRGGLWFTEETKKKMAEMRGEVYVPPLEATPPAPTLAAKPEKVKREPSKNDLRLAAMARELRDKWSEQIAPRMIATPADAKYDLRRVAGGSGLLPVDEPQRLKAASTLAIEDKRAA